MANRLCCGRWAPHASDATSRNATGIGRVRCLSHGTNWPSRVAMGTADASEPCVGNIFLLKWMQVHAQ
eukprot:4533555-Amphidinium_carterae.1